MYLRTKGACGRVELSKGDVMIIMGIDPGLTGGVVILNDQTVIFKSPMPIIKSSKTVSGKTKTKTLLDPVGLRELFLEWSGMVDMVMLEKVHAMPKQGISSTFTFGRVFGTLEGMLTALEYPVTMVSPQTWTKELHRGCERSLKPKDKSRLVLGRLFPGLDLTPTERSKMPHEGMLDALLLAEYGRRVLGA